MKNAKPYNTKWHFLDGFAVFFRRFVAVRYTKICRIIVKLWPTKSDTLLKTVYPHDASLRKIKKARSVGGTLCAVFIKYILSLDLSFIFYVKLCSVNYCSTGYDQRVIREYFWELQSESIAKTFNNYIGFEFIHCSIWSFLPF